MVSTTRGTSRVDGHPADDGSALTRPDGADEHRRALLARLPSQLAHVLTEPLGPLGLAGATAGELRSRDDRTAQLLREFGVRAVDALPDWDFGHHA
jgi:hypothetical protein